MRTVEEFELVFLLSLFFSFSLWTFAVESESAETRAGGVPPPSAEEILQDYDCKYQKVIACRQGKEQEDCPFKCIADHIECELKSKWKRMIFFSSFYAASFKDISCCVYKECPKDPKDCIFQYEREEERRRKEELQRESRSSSTVESNNSSRSKGVR